jgi:hypothetical protein
MAPETSISTAVYRPLAVRRRILAALPRARPSASDDSCHATARSGGGGSRGGEGEEKEEEEEEEQRVQAEERHEKEIHMSQHLPLLEIHRESALIFPAALGLGGYKKETR